MAIEQRGAPVSARPLGIGTAQQGPQLTPTPQCAIFSSRSKKQGVQQVSNHRLHLLLQSAHQSDLEACFEPVCFHILLQLPLHSAPFRAQSWKPHFDPRDASTQTVSVCFLICSQKGCSQRGRVSPMTSRKTCMLCRQAWLWVTKLVVIAAVLWLACLAVVHGVQPVSRRACNMSYVLMSLSTNWMMLLLFLSGSLVSMSVEPLDVLAACSHNMLPLFLVANVLTGAVNMSVNSLNVPDSQAVCIVCAYMGIICFIATVLLRSKLQIKLALTANKAKMV